MKFTILPDFEANKKRTGSPKTKNVQSEKGCAAKSEELLVSETEEVLAGVAGAVCPCVSDSWDGCAWYFRTVVQDTEDNAEFEMDQSQEIIQTYIERWYDELTAMGK